MKAEAGTFDSANNALEFLASTDEEYGKSKSLHQALDKKRRGVRFLAFLDATGTVAERNALAEQDSRYVVARDEWEEAMTSFYTLDARRDTARLLIETWRSVNSQQKKGNI